jgi:outer membrane immunogenic protein
LISAPAFAADMAVKAPPLAAVAPVPLYNWTSCYVGGDGGGLWAHKDWTNVTPGGPNGASGGHNVDGGIGGVQVGCDYQAYSNFVVGLQGNYGFTNAKGSNVNQLALGILDQTQIKSLAGVSARFGYAVDRFLAYVKAGGA